MKRRRGFTLVELLIVIAVMGMLSSMMMVSSSESVSTAKANNIISSLRNFSMAAMAYYTDNVETFGANPNKDIDFATVKKYMHNEGNIPDVDSYTVTNNSGVWWAGYNLTNENTSVKQKLSNRADSANLKGAGNTPPTTTPYPKYDSSSSGHTHVWLLIRSNQRPSE